MVSSFYIHARFMTPPALFVLAPLVIASFLAMPTFGDIIRIASVGDSVGANFGNRQSLSNGLQGNGIEHEFVGHNDYNATSAPFLTNAWGGSMYRGMRLGRTVDRGAGSKFEPGISHGVNEFDPDIIVFVGGNNDTQNSNSEQEFSELIEYLGTTQVPVVNDQSLPAQYQCRRLV